ncbi:MULTISPECIES: hypothetical protein [Staphylococcus]|uniref:hypothetical protein n=1 Tax=Staphylococcus TaxID=1279 RepID=UPI000853ED69|nr:MULTISPECIES: hypothetical protein [Staphylococcus]OEL06516.1 hypothetical protein AST04_13465 [Staphylococcus equorum]PTE76813.1 hypothetical protein BUY85_11170 [Staphylococcus equorum]PTH26174.1 hypothetical protein BU605_07405 [Staphylococcus arlettae]RIM79750.1 hypothetical protein BU593_06305 [Staphylococcus arlettae]
MKKIYKCTLLLASILVLASCSSDSSNSKETNNKNIKIGKMINSNKEHISYYINEEDTLDKDSRISYYIVSKNGKSKVYDDTGDTSLGEVSKMDEDELKKHMKKKDKEFFESRKKDVLKELEEGDDIVQEVINGEMTEENYENKDELEKYSKKYIKENGNVPKNSIEKTKDVSYKQPKAYKTKIGLNTDGSGNNTEVERYKFKNHNIYTTSTLDLDVNMGDLNIDSNEYGYTLNKITLEGNYFDDAPMERDFTGAFSGKEIYDKTYGGLSYYDEAEEENNYLITEIGDKVENVKLDSPKDKYVDEVDKEKIKEEE